MKESKGCLDLDCLITIKLSNPVMVTESAGGDRMVITSVLDHCLDDSLDIRTTSCSSDD